MFLLFLRRCSNDPLTLCFILQYEKILKPNTHILGAFPFGSWIFYFYFKVLATWNVLIPSWREQNDKKIFLSANALHLGYNLIQYDHCLKKIVTLSHVRTRKFKEALSTDSIIFMLDLNVAKRNYLFLIASIEFEKSIFSSIFSISITIISLWQKTSLFV